MTNVLNIQDLTLSDLVEVHNLLAPASAVKKFRDKATGLARLEPLMDGWEIHRFEDGELDVIEAPKAKAKGRKGRPPLIPNEARLTVLVSNPKRKGTPSYDRFELYTGCATVGDFIAKGGKRGDIIWDRDRKFIQIG